MSNDYDALYATTPDALGPPSPEIVSFFDKLEKPAARILDLGCGQGRDALFLARLGHRVTAVDLSPAGVADVARVAEAEGLEIMAEVADIRDYAPERAFDVVLIDRTLHMLGRADRVAVLARLLGHVMPGGWLLIADETSNLPDFRDVLARSGVSWTITRDGKGLFFARRG